MIFSTSSNRFLQRGLVFYHHYFNKSNIQKIPFSSTATTTRSCCNGKKMMIQQQQQQRRWNTNNYTDNAASTSTSTIAMPTPNQLRIVAFRAAIPVSCVTKMAF